MATLNMMLLGVFCA